MIEYQQTRTRSRNQPRRETRMTSVQRDRLADLSETLARASALADGLGSGSPTINVADRPSFLVAQPENDPQPIIERLAGAERLTFVIGAGASMEAGLPSWGNLVRALLQAAAPTTLSESDRVAWLDAAAETGLLGMAATARALAGSDEEFVKRVQHLLYRGKGPEHFDPVRSLLRSLRGSATIHKSSWRRSTTTNCSSAL